MTWLTRSLSVLQALATATMVVSACASTTAHNGGSSAPEVAAPPALQPPSQTKVLMKLHAEGTQIYVCQASAAPAAPQYSWVLRGPDAKLYDDAGHLTATHYAGPTWQSAVDGSAVVAKKIKDAPAPAPGAIPWLLLQTVSTTGHGQFSSVVAVQRLATAGGVAPTEACQAGSKGVVRATPYKAEYVFCGAE